MTQSSQPQSAPDDARETHGRGILFGALAIVALGIVFLFLPVGKWLDSVKQFIETLGWIGPLAFVLLYALFTVCLIPGSALTVVAGTLFGIGWGIVLVIAGSNLGAMGSFALARTLMHKRAEEWAKNRPRFQAVSDAIAKDGLTIVLLLRLSPVFPFTILNYLLGLTPLTFSQYAVGSFIGMLPGTIAFVYLGTLPAELASAARGGANPVRLAFYGLGLLATIAVTVIVTRLAKRSLVQRS